ncbi:MAG: GGDEF domain-containing protein [Acidimicrobiales bacterium]
MPRITKSIFTDTGLYMVGLGLAIGVVFPFFVIPLGVSAAHALSLPFIASCLLAGLLVGAFNFALTKSVLGRRIRDITGQMRHIRSVIDSATYSGDWSGCSPEECHLEAGSADDIGANAQAFNDLVDSLSASKRVEGAVSAFASVLSEHLDLDRLADASLSSLLSLAGAEAGALLVVRDGAMEVKASRRLAGIEAMAGSPVLTDALGSLVPVTVQLGDAVTIETAIVSFRPKSVVLLPARFKSVSVGLVAVASGHAIADDSVRMLSMLVSSLGVALSNADHFQRLQVLAAVDPLTSVYNRRFGFDRLSEEYTRAVRSGTPFGVAMFDVDKFKAVNDAHGHLVGDRVLKTVASVAREAMREGDVLVRYGGEEFLALLPGAGSSDVVEIGERIRRSIESSVVTEGGRSVSVTVSVGCASLAQGGIESKEDLLRAADQALYAAKAAGRNRLSIALTAVKPAGVAVGAV